MIRHCFAAAVLGASLLTACTWSDDPVTIDVLGPWEASAEQAAFEEVISAFQERAGDVRVRYDGTRDVSQVLRARIERGSPPDIAVFPRLYDLRSFVDSGALGPLDGIPGLPDGRLIRLDDRAYGVSIAAHVKSLVWSAGRDVDRPDLERRATAMLAAGQEAWCLGMSSPPVSGWPGTDWIENLMLDNGVDVYDEWTAGRLLWSIGPVREAWEAWQEMIAPDTLPRQATHPALPTRWQDAGLAMFDNPPGCLKHHAASFNADNYKGEPVTVHRFGDGRQGDRTLISEDVMGMFRDSPEAREFIRFLGDPGQAEGHEAWRKLNRTHMVLGQRPAAGTDPNLTTIETMLRTDTLCRDASDLMPPAVTEAFQHAVMRFLHDPKQLDALLADLDAVAARTREQWLTLPCFRAG